MGIDSQDIDVFQLLKQLKDTNGTYPQELFSARRQGYLRQVAEIGAGAGLAAALKTTVKSTSGAGSAPTASALLEGLLVVAIVAEASTVAYFYRSRIAEFLHAATIAPKVEEITNPPVLPSPIADFVFTPTPVVTEYVTPTIVETLTPVATPSLLVEQPTDKPDSNVDNSNPVAVSTQSANDKDNNGNQYGLTPKPIRTKEPGNNSNSNSDTQDNEPKPKKTK